MTDSLMASSRAYFEQFYRLRRTNPPIPPEERFAGANVRIPGDVRSILDVGCGDGEFLRWLPESYSKVGLDSSYEALVHVERRKIQGSIDALPFATSSFDLVACFEVLEHLTRKDLADALRELQRVSRKYIVVSVPNEEVLPQSLVWCPQCSCAFHPSWHVRSFDRTALGSLFPEFRMVECRPCGAVARYGATKFASLAVLLAKRRPPRAALCPQCGFSEAANAVAAREPAAEIRNTVSTGLWQRIVRLIGPRILFTARRPYWLLALYARTNQVQ